MPAVPQEVFISYKIGEARSEALRDALTRILQAAPYHLKVITDVGHLGMLEDLQAFMQRLARARYIIVILTPDYLASENCMYELSYMAQSGRLNERVFPIVYADVTIKDSASRLPYAKRWSDRLRDLKQQVAEMPAREVGKSTKNDLLKLESIVKGTQEALAAIAGMRFMGLGVGESLDAERIAGYVEQWVSTAEKKKKDTQINVRKYWLLLCAVLGLGAATWLGIVIYRASMSGPEPAVIMDQATDTLVHQEGSPTDGKVLGEQTPSQPHPEIQKLLDDMVFVRGGSFMMGSEDADKEANDDEKPRHEVRLSDYYIGKYEVTQAQWQAVMGDNPSKHTNCPQCPVERVSWNDCQTFLKKLNGLTGQRFNLPTEAQWEYAARGGEFGQGQNYQLAGGNDLEKVAWYRDNSSGRVHPVGGKAANALGLYDMSGNVWEWCRDRYDSVYYQHFKDEEAIDPTGPATGESFALRGGSWFGYPKVSRVAYRFSRQASSHYSNGGVRVQRD